MQDLLDTLVFQLLPEFERALDERDVIRVLVIGRADHAGEAVGGAFVVRDGELLQAQYAHAAPGKVVTGGGTHPADADDDDIESFIHGGGYYTRGDENSCAGDVVVAAAAARLDGG